MENAVSVEELKVWETFSRDQIEQIIQGNIRSVDEKMGQMMELFITSGYYLRRQYNEKMYREAGYDRFEDYVKDRYGKSRSWATRMMQINEQYSINGNDPRIDPKYKLYGVSQLQEMLYLTDEQRERASPDMTVKEIRALKTPAPVEEEQLSGQMNVEDFPGAMPELSDQEEGDNASCTDEGKKDIARCITGKSGSGHCGAAAYCNEPVNCCAACDKDCNGRCGWLDEAGDNCVCLYDDSITDCPAESAKCKSFEDLCCEDCLERCEIRCKHAERPEGMNEKTSESEIDFKALDKLIAIATSQKEEPDQCCESAADETESVAEIAADYIMTGTIEQPEEVIDAEYTEVTAEITPQSLLKDAQHWLEEYISCDAPKNLIEKQKILVAALAGMVCELEEAEPEATEQPELPVMKNNDQRKEWLRDYKAWGVWYYDENIDVYYYKYDFDNGDRLIVAEYPDRGAYWYGPGAKYTEKHYHLLEKERQCHSGQTYNHKFTHSPDSETYLVDYLKRVSKG